MASGANLGASAFLSRFVSFSFQGTSLSFIRICFIETSIISKATLIIYHPFLFMSICFLFFRRIEAALPI
ncbi:hypothetical protein I656_01587 [Geobacillus sp. WSUCF1]|nr:hypothetical protein I656_01587 [Geobacillus sp. WSUCF1]